MAQRWALNLGQKKGKEKDPPTSCPALIQQSLHTEKQQHIPRMNSFPGKLTLVHFLETGTEVGYERCVLSLGVDVLRVAEGCAD